MTALTRAEWRHAGGAVQWNREALTTAIVGTGGAWMPGSALLRPRAQRLNYTQRRGVVISGAGFLLTAIAARWLQGYGRIGIACSLLGTALAMVGMYQLVKERASRHGATSQTKPRE